MTRGFIVVSCLLGFRASGCKEVLEKIVKLRSDIENEVHQFVASATNIRPFSCETRLVLRRE